MSWSRARTDHPAVGNRRGFAIAENDGVRGRSGWVGEDARALVREYLGPTIISSLKVNLTHDPTLDHPGRFSPLSG